MKKHIIYTAIVRPKKTVADRRITVYSTENGILSYKVTSTKSNAKIDHGSILTDRILPIHTSEITGNVRQYFDDLFSDRFDIVTSNF